MGAAKLPSIQFAAMDDRDREDAGPFKHLQPRRQVEEFSCLFVVDVELEEVMREAAVMQRVPGVQPFAEQNEAIANIVSRTGRSPSSTA